MAVDIPWLVAVSLQSLPPWPHCLLFFCVCHMSFGLLLRAALVAVLRPWMSLESFGLPHMVKTALIPWDLESKASRWWQKCGQGQGEEEDERKTCVSNHEQSHPSAPCFLPLLFSPVSFLTLPVLFLSSELMLLWCVYAALWVRWSSLPPHYWLQTNTQWFCLIKTQPLPYSPLPPQSPSSTWLLDFCTGCFHPHWSCDSRDLATHSGSAHWASG
jgi:hypothetical protein